MFPETNWLVTLFPKNQKCVFLIFPVPSPAPQYCLWSPDPFTIFPLFPCSPEINSLVPQNPWDGLNSSYIPRGYSHLLFIHRLGPSIYRSPSKNIRNFKYPPPPQKKKKSQILATPKNIPILYLDLKKYPKMHRNDS